MSIKKTTAQKIFENIQEDIINGAMRDEEIITERGLAQKYKVSRTPVKEALKLLEAEGWVEISPRQETRIVPFDVEELLDMLSIRIAMETIAVKLCIQNLSQEAKDTFQIILEEMGELGVKIGNGSEDCLAAYNELDERFHIMVYNCSGNKILRNFYNSIRSLLKRIYRNIPLAPARIREGSQEIQCIIQYILKYDVTLAEAYTVKHVINSTDQKINAIKAGNYSRPQNYETENGGE